jgi:hypothetical protein
MTTRRQDFSSSFHPLIKSEIKRSAAVRICRRRRRLTGRDRDGTKLSTSSHLTVLKVRIEFSISLAFLGQSLWMKRSSAFFLPSGLHKNDLS